MAHEVGLHTEVALKFIVKIRFRADRNAGKEIKYNFKLF
jgi:hypothetical protein